MNVIEISEYNYQDYLSIEIVAFSFAFPGAMGEGGAIYILDNEGQIYHANYRKENDGISTEHIKDIIPVFEDIHFGIFGSKSNNDEWVSIYLGAGNHLLIVKAYNEGLFQKIEEAKFQYKSELFQYWPGFVLGLLGKGNDHLTMRDVWKIMDSNE